MRFDGQRQPDTLYVASVSRGKDSTAMLRAIQILGFPLDAIISVDIWFDDETPAELPPMVAFKEEWDRKCCEIFGIPVTRTTAMKDGRRRSYKDIFYKESQRGNRYGFPLIKKAWCQSMLKRDPLYKYFRGKGKIVHYIGIANDETERVQRHIQKDNVVLPLVEIGWDEALCGLEASYMEMLSPTYETGERDGCWFCHNQRVEQLRVLRDTYPELWEKLLEIDNDSPYPFKSGGHTIKDLEKRFLAEEEGSVPTDRRFRWTMLERERQMTFFGKRTFTEEEKL